MAKDTAEASTRSTTYVVLKEQVSDQDVVSYVVAATVSAPTAEAAKRLGMAQINPGEGEAVTILTVPARSWQPETFKVERPAPRLVKA